MQLSDTDIARFATDDFMIVPFSVAHLQPSTYDVHLNYLLSIKAGGSIIDLRQPRNVNHVSVDLRDYDFALLPGQCALGSTVEHFHIPDNIQARFDGKSSLGRDFLSTHCTAGIFDAGFNGYGVVELKNDGPDIWILYYDETNPMPIGQMSFIPLTSRVARPYGTVSLANHYQYQKGPVGNLTIAKETSRAVLSGVGSTQTASGVSS